MCLIITATSLEPIFNEKLQWLALVLHENWNVTVIKLFTQNKTQQ